MAEDIEAQNTGTPNQEDDRKTKGFWDEVPTAAKIASVFVAVALTFFATRYSLESDIAEIRKSLPTAEYSQKSLIYEQITNLRLIESELSRIEDFAKETNFEDFKYAKHDSKEAQDATARMRFFLRRPGEILIGRSGGETLPKELPVEAFASVVLTQATRSIQDSNLVTDLYRLHLAISDYNRVMLEADQTGRKNNPFYLARFHPGIDKETAEALAKEGSKSLEKIRTRLPGLASRVADARKQIKNL